MFWTKDEWIAARTKFSRSQRCAAERKNEKTFFFGESNFNMNKNWLVYLCVKLCVISERPPEATVRIYLSESFLQSSSFLFNFPLKRSPASAFQLNNWWILITSQCGLDSLPAKSHLLWEFSSFYRLLNPLKLLIDFPMNPLAFTARVSSVEVNQSVEWETFSLSSTWEVNCFFLYWLSYDARRLWRKSFARSVKLWVIFSPRVW